MEVRIVGRFLNLFPTPVWELASVDEEGESDQYLTMKVHVLSFPVIALCVDYEVVGVVVSDVMYPKRVGVRKAKWGENVSVAVYGALPEYVSALTKRRFANSPLAQLWENFDRRALAWKECGYDNAAFFSPRRPESRLIRFVRGKTIHRGCTELARATFEPMAESTRIELQALLDSEALVIFRDEMFMLGEVYKALDLIDALIRMKGLTFVDAADAQVDEVRAMFPDVPLIRHCERLGVEEVVERSGGAHILVGDVECGVRVNIYCGRELPPLIRIPRPSWIAESLVGAVKGGGSLRRLFVTPPEAKVDVEDGLTVLSVTGDVGGLGKAKFGVPYSARLAFERPTVGNLYRNRTNGEAAPLLYDAHRILTEFWRDYVPFDAAFAWEMREVDVILIIVTHETDKKMILRALGYAKIAVVICGASVEAVNALTA